MQKWMKNNNTTWEFIEYITLTSGCGDTYQKHIKTYYDRRFQDKRNDDGNLIKDAWISSFIINPTGVNEVIKASIYDHLATESSLKNLL